MALMRKNRGPLKKKYVFFIVLVLLTLISIQGFLFVERNLEPALKQYAKVHVQLLATEAMHTAISKKLSEGFEGGVLHIEHGPDGKTQLISFDSVTQARILNAVVSEANAELIKLEQKPFRIPIGQAFDSNILAQLGPYIPINLYPHGFSKADITVELEEAGINMVMVTAFLEIEASMHIVIPFASDEALVSTRYPIEWHLIQGEVPNVYFQGNDGQTQYPPVSIPLDDLQETQR